MPYTKSDATDLLCRTLSHCKAKYDIVTKGLYPDIAAVMTNRLNKIPEDKTWPTFTAMRAELDDTLMAMYNIVYRAEDSTAIAQPALA